MEMPEVKNTVTEIKSDSDTVFLTSLVALTQPRKESVNWKIGQEKLVKLKNKEEKQ